MSDAPANGSASTKARDSKGPVWSPAERNAALRTAARTAGLGALLYGAVTLIGMFLANTPLAALVAQTVGTEYGAGRLGISWTDPKKPPPTGRAIGKRIAQGAIAGIALAGIVVEILNVSHLAKLVPVSFALAPLATGLLAAVLTGVRDQILLSGVVLRVLSHVESALFRILACGAMFAAHAMVAEQPTLHEVVATGALGLFTGALWVKERSAFLPVAVNAGWIFATTTLFRGSFVEVVTDASAFAGGDAGLAGGYAAAALLVGASFFAALRRRG